MLITQSSPTLYHPMDCSPPGSSVHGNLQSRVVEWVAIPFSRDLPNAGTEPRSPALRADSSLSEPTGKPQESVFSLLMAKVQSLVWEPRFWKRQDKKKKRERKLNNGTNKFYIVYNYYSIKLFYSNKFHHSTHFFFLFLSGILWDLSSQTRDWIWALSSESTKS